MSFEKNKFSPSRENELFDRYSPVIVEDLLSVFI